MYFSIANIWQHSRHVLCSVWWKVNVQNYSNYLRVYFYQYLSLGIAVRRLGQFIPICFGCCKEIELWIRCDGLSFFCPFVSLFKHQTKKLMCKISGFLWEIISAKYMYLGQNYCKMFRAVYSIYFRVHTQIEPRIGRDVLFMFCPCLLCLVLNLKCCYHTVSWWLKKKFGSSFGIISCSLHEW